jgi:hypothetical protein
VLATQAPPAVGNDQYFLGYGSSNAQGSGSGIKRLGMSTIANAPGLPPDQIYFEPHAGSLPCSGDSDGPAFDYAANGFPVVHASVSGGDQDCSQFSIGTRVDTELTFIGQTASGTCLSSAPAAADCDGVFRAGMEFPLGP